MASKLLGRVPCVEPTCGFPSAHIKVNTDTEGKRPYRYCPECGSQYFPKTDRQAQNMMTGMRPEGAAPAAAPPAALPAAPLEEPAPPEKQFKTVFGVRVPV